MSDSRTDDLFLPIFPPKIVCNPSSSNLSATSAQPETPMLWYSLVPGFSPEYLPLESLCRHLGDLIKGLANQQGDCYQYASERLSRALSLLHSLRTKLTCRYVRDVMLLSPEEIIDACENYSENDVKKLYSVLATLLMTPNGLSSSTIKQVDEQGTEDRLFTTAFTLAQQNHSVKRVPTGCPVIDRALGGGILNKSITEIVGESAVGKTQLAIQLLLSCQNVENTHSDSLLNGKALYVCTESLSMRRIQQMAGEWRGRVERRHEGSRKRKREEELSERDPLQNIFIESALTLEALWNLLQFRVPSLLAMEHVR